MARHGAARLQDTHAETARLEEPGLTAVAEETEAGRALRRFSKRPAEKSATDITLREHPF